MSFVQIKDNIGANVTGTTAALTFTSNVTAGSAIFVGIAYATGNASSISDTQGNTYTRAVRSSHVRGVEIWHAFNCAAGATTVTVDYGGVSTTATHAILEYSGALDVLRSTNNAFSDPSVSSFPCGTVSADTGNLILCVSSTNGGYVGFTANANYTARLNPGLNLIIQERIAAGDSESQAGTYTTVSSEVYAGAQAVLGYAPWEASVAGSGNVAGGFTTAIALAGAVSGTATVAGALTTQISLTAAVTGSAQLSGAMGINFPGALLLF